MLHVLVVDSKHNLYSRKLLFMYNEGPEDGSTPTLVARIL